MDNKKTGCAVQATNPQGTLVPALAEINFNMLPHLYNNEITVVQGETVTLDLAMLYASDQETDDMALQFTMSDLNVGYFALTRNSSQAINTFTQQSVLNDAVIYVHDGSFNAPNYAVSVYDGTLSTPPLPATIYFTAFSTSPTPSPTVMPSVSFSTSASESWTVTPSPSFTSTHSPSVTASATPIIEVTESLKSLKPQIMTAQITLTDRSPITLTTAEFSAVSNVVAEEQLMFAVSNVAHSSFAYLISPTVPITAFLQSTVWEQRVQFIPDNTLHNPYFDVSVSDGTRQSIPMRVNVQIASAPVLTLSVIQLRQGQWLPFTGSYLQGHVAVPGDPLQIECVITEIMYSQFVWSNNQSRLDRFRLQDYASGKITYHHDGSPHSPFFSLTPVYDGISGISVDSRINGTALSSSST